MPDETPRKPSFPHIIDSATVWAGNGLRTMRIDYGYGVAESPVLTLTDDDGSKHVFDLAELCLGRLHYESFLDLMSKKR